MMSVQDSNAVAGGGDVGRAHAKTLKYYRPNEDCFEPRKFSRAKTVPDMDICYKQWSIFSSDCVNEWHSKCDTVYNDLDAKWSAWQDDYDEIYNY